MMSSKFLILLTLWHITPSSACNHSFILLFTELWPFIQWFTRRLLTQQNRNWRRSAWNAPQIDVQLINWTLSENSVSIEVHFDCGNISFLLFINSQYINLLFTSQISGTFWFWPPQPSLDFQRLVLLKYNQVCVCIIIMLPAI